MELSSFSNFRLSAKLLLLRNTHMSVRFEHAHYQSAVKQVYWELPIFSAAVKLLDLISFMLLIQTNTHSKLFSSN